jgi:hypothetical protein
MPARFPWIGVGAAMVAGVSLWFTRATLDVVATPHGVTRVATFPSWPELVGLSTLACLLAVLGRAFARRIERAALPHVTPAARTVPADVLVPLFAVSLLVLPYLPWIADVVPAITALAGPGAVFIWAIALGHVAWVAWDVWLQRRAGAWRAGSWPGALVVAILTGVIAAAASARLAGGPLAAFRDRLTATDGSDAAHLVTAIAGDARAVAVLLAAVTGVVAAVQWRAAARLTGSSAAATLGWLAVGLSVPLAVAPFAGSVSVVAALLVLVAVVGVGNPTDDRPLVLAIRGVALGLLPWLGAAHAPVSLVLVVLVGVAVAGRAGRVHLAWVAAPYAALAAWALAAGRATTIPMPAVAGEPAVGVVGRALALLADQEHGALLYVPALIAAAPGLWRLWRDGASSRHLAVQVGAATLAVPIAAAAIGGAPHGYVPGAALAPVLPLLALAIARWDRHVEGASVRRGLLRLLVSFGLATTASVLLVRDGALLLANRDGLAEWLVWLSPGYEVARIVPALAPADGTALGFWFSVGVWSLAIVLAGWAARRWRDEPPGRGAAVATGIALAAVLLPGAVIPLAGSHVPSRFEPASRSSSTGLHDFDARRRPHAVVYDPLRLMPASAVPALYSFTAEPGVRQQPQPVRVLLNTRLSLPAGTYRATITPHAAAAVRGPIGLQVGRIGLPLVTWHPDAPAGHPWTTTFHLDVDASFVGLRAAPELEAQVASLAIAPLEVIDASERPDLPPVLAATQYEDVRLYFHDEHAYTEATGFWVRGRTTMLATVAWTPERSDTPGITLKVHSGAAPNEVTLATPAWQTTIALEPGELRDVHVPARADQSQVHLRISPARAFVPAEHDGSTDRRELGAWVEIVR